MAPRSRTSRSEASAKRNGTQASVESYTRPWWCTERYIPSSAASRSAASAEASPRSRPGTSAALPYACRSEAQSTSSIPVNT